MVRSFILWVFISVICSSCGPTILHESKRTLNGQWSYDNKLSFVFEVVDTEKKYDIVLKVEHVPDFAYENFYTKVKTIFPNDTTVVDPLSIELASNNGTWLSDCSKDMCTLHLLMLDDVRFQHTGRYEIIFIQDSRVETLEGLESMTLSIVEASK